MKLLFSIALFFFLSVSSSFAYLEVETAGDAKATANEQTTNLYLLNHSNSSTLKRLKNIEELYSKNPELANKLSHDEIEQIASGDSSELQRQDILKEIKQYLHKAISNKSSLIVKRDANFYQQLTNNALQSKNDRGILSGLSMKLGRLR